MKNVLFFIGLLLLLFSCKKKIEIPTEPYEFTIEDVFPKQKQSDSVFVVNMDSIKTIGFLIEDLCKDYNGITNKNLFIRNDLIDIKFESVNSFCRPVCTRLRFHNTLLFKVKDDFFLCRNEIKDFNSENVLYLMKLHYFNNGIDKDYSVSPDKFFIIITQNIDTDINSTNFNRKISVISKSYFEFIKEFELDSKLDSLKNRYPLNILFELSVSLPEASELSPSFEVKEL